MSRLHIVLGGGVADYPVGGGHWSVFLQYLLGLKALGHDVFWLDFFKSSGDSRWDKQCIDLFFRRFRYYGLHGSAAVLQYRKQLPDLELGSCQTYGLDTPRLKQVAQSADLLWNFCGGTPRSL